MRDRPELSATATTNQRRCVACRRLDDKTAFWRIVRVYPSRAVQLDHGMGRSAYLCPQAKCLQAAQKKDRLGRSLRSPVPPAIYQQLWERLAQKSPGGGAAGGQHTSAGQS